MGDGLFFVGMDGKNGRCREFFLYNFCIKIVPYLLKIVIFAANMLEMRVFVEKSGKDVRENLVNPDFCVTHTHTHTYILC